MFWTPSAAAYLNDTLVGTLVIGFALLLPPVPGVSPVALASGPDIPPGWDYNPSGWLQRLPIIALAFVGLFVSRYLAAYQLGHIDSAWDPLFGDGTERIITSEVSKAWPVPDAGLGAVTYILEILTGFLGDQRRWRTAPWVVILFGLMIVPLGAVSIFFIIIQPIVIGTWCTLCLVAAVAMLLQIPYSFDELLASGQFLLERRRQGQSLLQAFLFGDTIEGGSEGPRDEFAAPVRTVIRESLGGGVNLPWSLAASLAVGIWLMCTRLSFGTIGAQADSDHPLGALIITVSMSALAEMARPLRFINILLGIALMGAPLLFDGGTPLADWAGVLAGGYWSCCPSRAARCETNMEAGMGSSFRDSCSKQLPARVTPLHTPVLLQGEGEATVLKVKRYYAIRFPTGCAPQDLARCTAAPKTAVGLWTMRLRRTGALAVENAARLPPRTPLPTTSTVF